MSREIREIMRKKRSEKQGEKREMGEKERENGRGRESAGERCTKGERGRALWRWEKECRTESQPRGGKERESKGVGEEESGREREQDAEEIHFVQFGACFLMSCFALV